MIISQFALKYTRTQMYSHSNTHTDLHSKSNRRYLGAVTAAFFTALAMQRKHPVQSWGRLLLNVAVPYAMEFVKLMYGKDAPDLKASSYFCEKWNAYLKLRGIANHNENKPIFPSRYDVQDRDTFYASVSFSGWGGASGHDAPMIA